MIFSAASFNADLNSGTLSDLAGQGTHGVEVVVVAALAVIVCALFVFIFRFYQESRKYDQLRDGVLKDLIAAVHEYSHESELRDAKISESLDRIEDDFGEGIEKLTEKVDEHGQRLDEIDDKLEEHDGLLAAAKPAAQAEKPSKQKKHKGTKK